MIVIGSVDPPAIPGPPPPLAAGAAEAAGPDATRCSGVTFAPRVSACGTSDCTCGILFAIRVYSARVPSTIPMMRRLVAHMRRLRRRNERRFFREPAEPENEADEGEEDQHAGTDHDRGVAQRRRRGVRRRILHDLPDMPVLADAAARESHQTHQPRERDRENE